MGGGRGGGAVKGGMGAPMVWAGRVEKGGVPRVGDPNPEEVGVRRVGGQKFRAFFHSPAAIFFLSSLWGSFRGILVVF